MEGPAGTPSTDPSAADPSAAGPPAAGPSASGSTGLPSATDAGEDRAFAAILASVERLDALGLADERGLVLVEPATTFGLE